MELIVFSEKVFDLVDPTARLEKLATGFVKAEGPVYLDNGIYFTDWQAEKIYRYENGKTILIKDQTFMAIGMTYDHKKERILRCTRERHAVTDLDGKVVVGNYKGVRLNGSNDIIVDSKGRIYFTDPLSRKIEGEQIGHSSVFMYEEDKDELTMLESTLSYPNGLAFSPDEAILFIVNTDTFTLYKLELATMKLEPFFHFDQSMGEGRPDGLRLDEKGNIYVTGPGGLWLLDPHGEVLGLIKLPERASNLCFDEKGIFITANTSIYRVDTKIPSAK